MSCGKAVILGRKTVEFLQKNGLSPEQRKTLEWDSVRGFRYANLMRVLENRNLAGFIATEGSFERCTNITTIHNLSRTKILYKTSD